jgi:hypothetical protein
MTSIQTASGTIIVVEVPENSYSHLCKNLINNKTVISYRLEKSNEGHGFIEIPKEDYEFLGTCTQSDIDFDVEEFVEKWDNGEYQDYILFRGHLHNCVETKEESFRTLLQANGIIFKPESKFVILKKL